MNVFQNHGLGKYVNGKINELSKEYICSDFLDSTPKVQVIKRNQNDNACALCIGFSSAAYDRVSNNMTG